MIEHQNPGVENMIELKPGADRAPSATAKSAMEELGRHYRRWYKRSLPDWASNPGADRAPSATAKSAMEELGRHYRRWYKRAF